MRVYDDTRARLADAPASDDAGDLAAQVVALGALPAPVWGSDRQSFDLAVEVLARLALCAAAPIPADWLVAAVLRDPNHPRRGELAEHVAYSLSASRLLQVDGMQLHITEADRAFATHFPLPPAARGELEMALLLIAQAALARTDLATLRLMTPHLRALADVACAERRERAFVLVHTLGMSFAHLDAFDDARPVLEQSLTLAEQTEPPQTVAHVLKDLGYTAQQQRDYSAAIAYFQRLLEQSLERFGYEHLETADALNLLGVVAWQIGDLEHAATLFGKVRVLREALLPADDPAIGQVTGNMGMVLLSSGSPALALEHLLRALQVAERHDDHNALLNGLRNVAEAYSGIGQVREAITYEERALALVEGRYGAHDRTLHILNTLGHLYLAANEQRLARATFDRSRVMAIALHGASDETVAYAQSHLDAIDSGKPCLHVPQWN